MDAVDPRTIVLVTGGDSYRRSGAAAAIEPSLKGRTIERIEGIRPNPTLRDVVSVVDVLRRLEPDLVVAVGGGSVLDVAKAARGLALEPDPRAAVMAGTVSAALRVPLVAIPTTAGSGSEATHFSAVYVDGAKYSIAHEELRPEHVVLDPDLTTSMSPRLTAQTGFDALAQAMESMWSTRSTEVSLEYARQALELAWNNLEHAVSSASPESRLAMCAAAHLSGSAIDVSKTTAAHALSYSITVGHGVAHGHAVALTLGALLEFNSAVTDGDCCDRRGAVYVRERISEVLATLGVSDGVNGRREIRELMSRVGLETTLTALGVTTPAGRAAIVESVDAERLANNPRALGRAELHSIVDGVS